MSTNADTIRRELYRHTPYVSEESFFALDALLAEVEQLRTALQQVDAYIKDLALPGPETNWIHAIVRAALAEEADRGRAETHFVPAGDERCGYEIDACRCMKRKGHDGLHGCAHGDWGDRFARAPVDLSVAEEADRG